MANENDKLSSTELIERQGAFMVFLVAAGVLAILWYVGSKS